MQLRPKVFSSIASLLQEHLKFFQELKIRYGYDHASDLYHQERNLSRSENSLSQ